MFKIIPENRTSEECKVRPSWSLRLAQIMGVGTLIWLIFIFTGFQYNSWMEMLLDWCQDVLITFLTWESVEFSIKRGAGFFSWRKHPILRFVVQAAIVPTVSAFTIGVPMIIFSWISTGNFEINSGFRIMLIIGILFSLLLSTVLSAMDFYKQSLKSALEIELLKEEGLRSQLETLRQQVNPHFLFNSLNVLSALIPIDSDRAREFVHQLSKVYRYVLDAGKSEFVEIQEELDFLSAYGYLLQQRFGDALIWDINQDQLLKGKVPALSLQLLAENAVKHNIVSKSRPLTIRIITKGDSVCVINNLQKKSISDISTEIGLNNIIQRYRLSGYPLPVIHQTDHTFEVVLPLV